MRGSDRTVDVDAVKVIDELTAQISRLSYELAVARAQVKTMQEGASRQPVDAPTSIGESGQA